jgi:hypothetical protein
MPALANAALVSGESARLTPPASAAAQLPSASAATAVCAATRLLLQAVSTDMAGPRRPKV